ncbi:MAG: polysaccharide biosynthesis tyrosine autokinase [Opitutales bacterium]|nr:polysaccharide biosynthesis tyrosine autokinase [Opitutales bacterium]
MTNIPPQYPQPNRPPEQGGSNRSSRDQSGYGYGYGYGYAQYGAQGPGYGYGGYGAGEKTPHRSIKDYLVMFRERIWYFIVTFALVLSSSILYTYNATPIYESIATVEILRDDPNALGNQAIDLDINEIRSAEDLNTQVGLLESIAIIEKVEQRMTPDERQRFLGPYQNSFMSGPVTPLSVLGDNREVTPFRLSLMVGISYRHPDQDMAARVANLFAEEFISYNLSRSIDTSMKAVEDLKVKAAQQRSEVERLRRELADFRERYNSVSLDSEENIAIQELVRINDLVVSAKSDYDRALTLWEQIQEYQKESQDLWEVTFIAQNQRVAELLSIVSANKIEISTLAKRYRDKNPKMIAAREALRESEVELDRALETAVREAFSAYEQTQNNYESAQQRLQAQETELIELSKLKVEYESLESDLRVQELFYQDLVARYSQESTQVNIKNPNARIVDRARPPVSPSSPKPLLNIALGLVGGGAAGLGLVFLLAFLDDKVKTAFDIEAVVGVPLVGIVPRIKRLDASEKPQAAAGNHDRHVTEAFRSIHSTLRLNEDSRDAQVIITTSTVPSEGKSFCSTNLALTYATHGEKVLLLDGDLRLPNVAKSLEMEVSHGIVTHFEQGDDLDKCIVKELYPNLDVLPAGAKAKNPTQILNSPRIEELFTDLRKQYTKIIVDTPPLAAVSDTLNLLGHADGLIYVIKFNTVKRRSAKMNVRRLLDSNTPVFGAILNNIGLNISSYYYSHYYDSAYSDYYVKIDEDQRGEILARNEQA